MMRIKWIEFENKDTNFKINKTCFFENSTLLVGRSGAGKTQILEAIKTLCKIARNDSKVLLNIEGAICFVFKEIEYIWCVKTKTKFNKFQLNFEFPSTQAELFDYMGLTSQATFITNEILSFRSNYPNDIAVDTFRPSRKYEGYYEIFKRDERNLFIHGYNKLPEINNTVSLISMYNNNDMIKNAYACVNQIYEMSNPKQCFMPFNFLNKLKDDRKKLKNCKTDDDYRDCFPSYYPIPAKVELIKSTNPDLYNDLLSMFQRTFPDIDDFDVKFSRYNHQFLTLYFSTNDSEIEFDALSMGMAKTFIYLLDLITISNDYVVMIDEIENGLGVNCIDDVYDSFSILRPDLQFIITSHHPYIINNVSPNSCMIVDRNKNIVSTYSAKELGIANSHHDFYDLVMNKLKYGIIE